MTDRAKARAVRLAALLNGDGTVTPAEDLPQGLLTETCEGLEATSLEIPEVLARRGLSKGRLSQLERPDLNPQLSTITQQADALDYDVTIVFTPRQKDRHTVRVTLKPASHP